MRSNIHALPVRRTSHEAGNQHTRRLMPMRGRLLTLANIGGDWRPSGTAGGVGVFCVVWSTYGGEFWAALHDFDQATRLRLLDECRQRDRDAGFPGAWPEGRR